MHAGSWLRRAFISRPINHGNQADPWARVLDGIVVLQEMTHNEQADR